MYEMRGLFERVWCRECHKKKNCDIQDIYNSPLPIACFQHSLTDGVDRSLIDRDINVRHVLTAMSVYFQDLEVSDRRVREKGGGRIYGRWKDFRDKMIKSVCIICTTQYTKWLGANSNHKRISKRSPFLVVLMMSSLLARPIFFFNIFFRICQVRCHAAMIWYVCWEQ